MAEQKQDDQHEHTFSNYVRIRDVVREDLPEAMNDRERWRERVRDIRATSTTWWWWYIYIYIYIYIYCVFVFIMHIINIKPSWLGLQNTPTAFLQRSKTPTSMSVLDMALNYLTLKLWRMLSTLSLPSLPGSLWPGMLAPDRVLSMGKKNCLTLKQTANRWLMLNWIMRSRTVELFNSVYLQNVFTNHIEDLALNNLQWLICHKTQPNQIIHI